MIDKEPEITDANFSCCKWLFPVGLCIKFANKITTTFFQWLTFGDKPKLKFCTEISTDTKVHQIWCLHTEKASFRSIPISDWTSAVPFSSIFLNKSSTCFISLAVGDKRFLYPILAKSLSGKRGGGAKILPKFSLSSCITLILVPYLNLKWLSK